MTWQARLGCLVSVVCLSTKCTSTALYFFSNYILNWLLAVGLQHSNQAPAWLRWRELLFRSGWKSWPCSDILTMPNHNELKRKGLDASTDRPQVVTMQEKPTPQRTDFLVRNGRRQSHMITVSPMWEITTSVGIQMGFLHPRPGVTPLIPKSGKHLYRKHLVNFWASSVFCFLVGGGSNHFPWI